MKTNITIIGGGSRQWAIRFMKDLSVDASIEGTLTLYDIDEQAAINNVEVGERIFALNSKDPQRFKIVSEKNLGKALTGANLVLFSIEPGNTTCRKGDLLLPEEYDILQTVGDTTGPGGIMRAKRALPLFFDFGKALKKYCPKAWIINYTNPMTLCTAALFKVFPEIKLLGCCHEVFGTQHFIAQLVAKWFNVPEPDRRDIHLDITGVNHFTFATKAVWNGIDLMPRLCEMANKKETYKDLTNTAQDRIKNKKWFDCDHIIALELLKNFGALGAAGDRHLAEFLPCYLTSDENIWKRGIMRTPYSWRIETAEEKRAKIFTDKELTYDESDEEGVAIMKALHGGTPLYTNMNRLNEGQISYLPLGTVVESNGFISQDSIKPVVSSEPTPAVKNLIQRVSAVQQMTLDAIWNDDNEALFAAFIEDPLMHLPLDQARELFNKMLVASALKY